MTDHRKYARRFSQIVAAAISLLLTLSTAHAADTVTYYHTDALGTPVMESNAAGTVTYAREHKPYGEQALGAAKNGPGFTGHVGDTDAGLTYMQARYYDATAGRFLSNDPVMAGQSTGSNYNRYWYANNNPYGFVDPNGRQAKRNDKKTDCDIECKRQRQEDRRRRADEPFAPTRTFAALAAAAPAAGVGGGTSAAPTTGLGAFLRSLLGRAVITAPLVIGGDSRKVPTAIIGEGMTERVIPYAESTGSEYYIAAPAPPEMWMTNNRIWINQIMDRGYRIIDIGPMRGRENYPLPTSPYYKMELSEISKRGYYTYKVKVP